MLPAYRRGIVISFCLLLFSILLASASWAIRGTQETRRDARRFGLNRLEPRHRRAPSEASQRAFSSFNRREGGRWQIRFNERTGRPSALVGGTSSPRPGTPRQAAEAFLGEAAAMLGIEPADLEVEKQSSGDGHSHLLYRQTYRGLPVEFSRVKVHLDASGAVIGVHSNFEPDLSLSLSPSLDAAAASEIVRSDAGRPPDGAGALVIFPNPVSGRAHLAWKFSARRGGLWRYYIDAHTGELLFRYDDLRHAAPPVCLTSGTVRGEVYDIDPSTTPGPVLRPFNHLRVYVVDGSTFAVTGGDATFGAGFYCSGTQGKVFSQLQGSFVNVANFRGPSAHYDNGSGSWNTIATPVSSPHPYSNSAVHIATISLAVDAPSAVKFLPVFTNFEVGAVSGGSYDESGDITDDDELEIIDSLGNPVAAYVGNRGGFRGAAVPGHSMRLRLTSNASGQRSGYDVSLSSYLVLSNPNDYGPSGSFTWTASSHTSTGLRSEINLFYHLNLMHDYFMADVNKSSAAFIGKPVNAMALVGPSVVNAFYDPAHDNLLFGDVSDGAPSDLMSEDATVSHHEYTHYVIEKIWPIQNFGQAGAISEALADYFSASSLGYSSIGTHLNGGLGNSGALRELDCPAKTSCRVLTASNWIGEIHDDSLYLSQALWEIRQARISLQGAAAGRSCADGLVFQSLLFFPESFQEFLDAMRRVDSAGAVAACGGANAVQATINARFSAHGLQMSPGSNDAYDTASRRNDGFESAVDISTLGAVGATIFPAGDLDFYAFAAGPGRIRIVLSLPPDGSFFKGYAMTLYDSRRKSVAEAAPAYDGINTDLGLCEETDCTTTRQTVILEYQNAVPGQFYLQVAGGATVSGASNSGVNSAVPYSLSASFPRSSALSAGIVSASYDNDAISFSVMVSTFPRTQDRYFAYAQLTDQSQTPLAGTRTQDPALASDLLVLVSSVNGLGAITGQVRIAPGFAARFPAVGTVHLEVFAYNIGGSTVSVGLSPPLNLTANRAALTAWNNVFNPARGEKTTIKFEIQSPGRVTLRLYRLDGTFIATLADGVYPAGKGSVDWFGRNFSGSTVASGVYLLHMTGPGLTKTQKIAVVK